MSKKASEQNHEWIVESAPTSDSSNLEFRSVEEVDLTQGLATALAVGHSPRVTLSPNDEALFHSFQSNLLSLISHELRTPLTGILNALSILQDIFQSLPSTVLETAQISPTEMLKMAHRNARHLHQTLISLLDLAALESGTFHVRLREVDFVRIVKNQIEAQTVPLKNSGLSWTWSPRSAKAIETSDTTDFPVLGDPLRLAQVIDLCFRILLPRVQARSILELDLDPHRFELAFQLTPEAVQNWEAIWSQSLVSFQGRISSSAAFAGVFQSEQAFLNRTEEGLGSEFLLIQELMKLHRGRFTAELDVQRVKLKLYLPELDSEQGLQLVLDSRVFQTSTQLGSVALILIAIPEHLKMNELRHHIRTHLFRSTDAVYPMTERQQLALVLDDCKSENIPKLIGRLTKSLEEYSFTPKFGSAICPIDTLETRSLIEIAQKRLSS